MYASVYTRRKTQETARELIVYTSESNSNQRNQSKTLSSGERYVSCFLFSTIFRKKGLHVHFSKINKVAAKTYLIAKSISGENKI